MGELRSVARAYALEGHGPVALVERMNGYHAMLGADLMTTMIFAVLEIDAGTLRFVNAGHPPPVLVGADGATEVLEGGGVPLGALDSAIYEERAVALAPGASALLYTDGLVERRGEALDDRVAELCRSASGGGTPRALCDRVLRAMGATGADDDVTVIAVRSEATLGDHVSLRLTPDPDALMALRRLTTRWLGEMGAEGDETRDLVMAANEAWQNALEHGTGFARTSVVVDLEADDEDVRITVRNPVARRPGPPRSDPDRGRGLALMRALADDVALDLAPRESTVRLRRTLRTRAARRSVAGLPG
jgi:anti-sigma regulatory factor (Ser/Thr protein kinase)